MAKKPETHLQQRIQRALKAEFGGFWFKVHGGPFQPAGIPDLLGCVDGLYVAIEVKIPGEEPSSIQEITIEDIRNAGGISFVTDSVEHAVATLARFASVSKAGRRVRSLSWWLLSVLRAAPRKNLRNARLHRTAGRREPTVQGSRRRSKG